MSSQAAGSTRDIEFLAWVELNKNKLLAGAGIIAVMVAALAIYRWYQREAEASANAALFRVYAVAGGSENAAPPAAQAWLDVAGAHAGTGAGARAALLAAGAMFSDGKFAEARTQFEDFLREYPEHSFVPSAAYGAAACLDAMGKTNEALTAFQNVATRFGRSPVAAQAKLGAAGLHEALNEPAQALKLYEELIRESERTAWANEIAMRREVLLLRHPELINSSAPAFDPPQSAAPTISPAPLIDVHPVPVESTNPGAGRPAGD